MKRLKKRCLLDLFSLLDFLTNLYQGDIDLEGDAELEEYITTGGNSRNAIRQRKRLWTSRVIPYRIAPVLRMYISPEAAAFKVSSCSSKQNLCLSLEKNWFQERT